MKKDANDWSYLPEEWNEKTVRLFRKQLLNWYDSEKRDLPWRQNTNAYSVWVSEIMLQQTRVDTVIPYYERFLLEFPTIQDLANAPEDRLLKVWEGLGYYSRVRNMQAAAKQIMENFGGIFPQNMTDILSLKGIGPYTGGAVGSIAFGLPEPAIDGNVMRVIGRMFEIEADIAKPATRKIYDSILRVLIDPERPGDFNQALMDLGSTVSTPTYYREEMNPIKEFDRSYLNGTWREYPVKSKKKKPVPVEYAAVAVLNQNNEWLLKKRPEKGVLRDMWLFPLYESQREKEDLQWKDFPESVATELKDHIYETTGLDVMFSGQTAGKVTHIFSHLKWMINVYPGKPGAHTKENLILPEGFRWVSEDEMKDFIIPVPQQKMLELLKEDTGF